MNPIRNSGDAFGPPTLAIVGAGAAGLAAAIFAGEAARALDPAHRPRIALLDGAKKIGAKILVAGGGRCNVTHDVVTPDDYHGNRNIIRNVLATFPVEQTVDWFASLGVDLKREPTGKLFPVTDQARTVLDALLHRCRALNVDLLTDHRVAGITAPPKPGAEPGEAPAAPAAFKLTHRRGALDADAVVLATGGRSLPRTGSDGQGYKLARALGHSVAETHAALVPLQLDGGFFHAALAGVSHEATLATFVDGKLADRRTGPLLWTHVGASGPVVMDASRFFTMAADAGRAVEVRLGALVGVDVAGVDAMIAGAARREPRSTLGRLFDDKLPARFMPTLLAHLGLEAGQTLATLRKPDRRALARALAELPLPVVAHRGWNYAEVTAGGVPLSEIDHKTMRSRRTPGLYLIGEVLDCDGHIGGFNFQWAWATGRLAGTAAAAALASGATA